MVRRKYIVTTKRQKKKWSSQMSYVAEHINYIRNIAGPFGPVVCQYSIPIVSNISNANIAQTIMKVKNFKVSLTFNNYNSNLVINPGAENIQNTMVKCHLSLCYYKQNQPPSQIEGIFPLNRSYLFTCPEYVIATKVIQYSVGQLQNGQDGSVNPRNFSQISWNVSSRLARNLQTGDGIFLLVSTFPISSDFNSTWHLGGSLDGVIRYWTVSQ